MEKSLKYDIKKEVFTSWFSPWIICQKRFLGIWLNMKTREKFLDDNRHILVELGLLNLVTTSYRKLQNLEYHRRKKLEKRYLLPNLYEKDSNSNNNMMKKTS